MPRSLPPRPSLRYLQEEAKDLLKAHRRGDASVCPTFRLLPRFARASNAEILSAKTSLASIQFAHALDYGHKTWGDLKRFVESHAEPASASTDDTTTFAGEVLDKDTGAPLADVTVQTIRKPLLSTKTDREGRFRLPGLEVMAGRDKLWIEILPDGYAGELVLLNLSPGRTYERIIRLGREAVVAGRVCDEMGNPVPDVIVHGHVTGASGYEMPGMDARTDREGRYIIRHVPRDQEFSLMAEKKGCLTASTSMAAPLEGGGLTHDFVLKPGPEISGIVVDQAGKPLEGVHLYGRDRERETTSDAQGRFSFGGLSCTLDHPYVVSAVKDGYAVAWRLVGGGYGTEATKVVLTLRPEQSIKGVVADETSAPVPNASIWVERPELVGESSRTESSLTGTFTLSKLDEGRHNVSVRAKGFPGQVFRSIEAGPTGIRLALRKGASFIGRVIDADTGSPITTFTVIGDYTRSRRPRPGESIENGEPQDFQTANGVFDLKTPVNPDSVQRLIVVAPGYCVEEEDVVRPGRQVEVRLKKAKPMVVHVVDEHNKRDIDGAVVKFHYFRGCLAWRSGSDPAWHPGAFLPPLESITLGKGRYEFSGIGNGPWLLEVTASGYLPYTQIFKDGPEASVVEVAAVPRRAEDTSGIVVDHAGKPLAGVTVRWGIPGEVQREAVSDAQGRFCLEGLAMRCRVEMSAVKDGYAVDRHIVDLRNPAEMPGLVFTLRPEHTISGIVVDKAGTPTSNVFVGVTMTSGDPRITRTDANGAFTVSKLEEGTCKLIFWHERFAVQRSPTVKVGARDVRLTLHEGASLSGKVRDADTGSPVESFFVRLAAFKVGSSDMEISGWEQDFQNAKGLFDLRERQLMLSPNDVWRLVVVASGYCVGEVDGVKPGMPVEVRLQKARPVIVHVVDGGSKKAIGSAQVRFYYWIGRGTLDTGRDPVLDDDFLSPFEAKAIDEGRYEVSGIGAGPWLLKVTARGYARHVQFLADGTNASALDVLLREV